MANIYLPVGSVTGTATAVANVLAETLNAAGHNALVDANASVAVLNAQSWDAVLVVTSTTGQGDIPANLLPFYVQLDEQFPLQNGRPFGVVSLGDSSYDRTFCNAGALLEERFFELQGKAPIPRVTIDATETSTPDDDALFWLKEWMEVALA
jgi:flavodoxin